MWAKNVEVPLRRGPRGGMFLGRFLVVTWYRQRKCECALRLCSYVELSLHCIQLRHIMPVASSNTLLMTIERILQEVSGDGVSGYEVY